MIHLPRVRQGPLRALAIRLALAIMLVLGTVAVIYADRDGYRDINDDGLTLLDCFYYAVVSLSTTGYGDITPFSPHARLVNVLVITPARVLFLIILVGTTLEVLTDQYRNSLRVSRWRRHLKDHIIICGYGTKGRAAVAALLETGYDKSRIVLVENRPEGVRQAAANGLVAIEGNATRSAVLLEADGFRLRQVVDNLLTNAIKYNVEGGSVRVGVQTGVDEVDLYLIHWPQGGPTWAWPGMEAAKASGYTRSIGVSNFSAAELDVISGGLQ